MRELQGPNAGAVYELRDLCVLGRALDCQVHIRDLTVSRRHARISKVDGRYVVEDLGSGNGTYVNDKAVTRHFLSHRDVIRVCSARFEFQEHEQRPDAVTYVGDPAAMAQIVKRVDAAQPLFRQDAAALTTVTDPKAVIAMAERLETIYAVSEAISSILDLDELLPEIVNRVFAVFPKAERVLLMLTGDDGHLVPKVVKRRSETDDAEVKVSQTILHEVTTQRNAVLSHDAMEDQRFKGGRSVANFGIRAMMAAPLVWRTEVLGVLYLDSFGIAAFTQADLSLLTGIAGQSAGAVGNARLHEELLKRQRLERDLHLAERIQQSFLPRKIPKVRGYSFSARYDPAYEVGGDFYDFIRLPDDRLGLVVADVSGKGVSAALYMARLTRDLRYFALAESDPARVLGWMNRAVIEFGQDDMFVTLLYAVLDAHGRRLHFANAGHMPPVVRRRDEGDVLVLDQVSGLPLGVLPDAEYEADSFELIPGDSVMLYTDGLVEAMSPSREMYGMARLVQAMASGPSDAALLLERALTSCRDHVGDAPQFDDTTVVCVGLEHPDRPPDAAITAREEPPRTGEIDLNQGAYRSRRPRPRTRS
ncbi:MAG: SpoIIE family protein phosphatase [Myxococcales bacterium]|nr:SpoIIE family protein phosphatase [Myxococcales bacterium]MCB9646178.1 SpoIIE family protein phosphatase [Deltaproteobacteria bacterium]